MLEILEERLERVVGEGGMGVVWAARELATGRRVALKFLREGREVDVRNQERVLREARAAMAISHANVAKVEAVLETDAGVPFLVMELLEGESLRELLRRRPTLAPIECARILLPVVEAVLAAHASHLVHRDLKPENVFLGKDQRVRVLDFGIAKQLPKGGAQAAESLTSTGAVLGTPIYMAPEQIFGDEDIDGSADVWSLGIVLYECLAGKRPTDGDGFGPIIKRITTETLEPLEHAREDVPRRLTSLVGRMLTRDRTRRPALVEVRAVLAALVEAGEGAAPSDRAPEVQLHELPPLASSTTGGVASLRAVTDTPERAPPRRRSVALIAGMLGILAVIGGLEAWRITRARPAAAQDRRAMGSAFAKEMMAGANVIAEAVAAQAKRDGATCLAKYDEFDRQYAAEANVPVTTDPASGSAGVRAICMMLEGRCAEGIALYAAWVKPYVPDAGSADDATDNTAINYCEGPAVTPRLALIRAKQRLTFWGSSPGVPGVTAAQCQSWAADERRFAPVVGDLPVVAYAESPEQRLATCLKRAGEAP